MTDTVEMLDHRHRGFASDSFDQRTAPARNGDIDQVAHGKQFTDDAAIRGIHKLYGMLRKSLGDQ